MDRVCAAAAGESCSIERARTAIAVAVVIAAGGSAEVDDSGGAVGEPVRALVQDRGVDGQSHGGDDVWQ